MIITSLSLSCMCIRSHDVDVCRRLYKGKPSFFISAGKINTFSLLLKNVFNGKEKIIYFFLPVSSNFNLQRAAIWHLLKEHLWLNSMAAKRHLESGTAEEKKKKSYSGHNFLDATSNERIFNFQASGRLRTYEAASFAKCRQSKREKIFSPEAASCLLLLLSIYIQLSVFCIQIRTYNLLWSRF